MPHEKIHWKVITTLSDVVGNNNQYSDRITNEFRIGENQSRIKINGLGHWFLNRDSCLCERICRTKYRLDCLKTAMSENNVRIHGVIAIPI